jgi:ABC-2 type transport system ATP-binding protein
MGYVPEEPHLYSHLSGLEFLTMVGQLRSLPASATADRIDGLLRLFSLHGDRHTSISSYSKGMRQKVLLSAALLHNPDLYCWTNLSPGWTFRRGWCCAA